MRFKMTSVCGHVMTLDFIGGYIMLCNLIIALYHRWNLSQYILLLYSLYFAFNFNLYFNCHFIYSHFKVSFSILFKTK